MNERFQFTFGHNVSLSTKNDPLYWTQHFKDTSFPFFSRILLFLSFSPFLPSFLFVSHSFKSILDPLCNGFFSSIFSLSSLLFLSLFVHLVSFFFLNRSFSSYFSHSSIYYHFDSKETREEEQSDHQCHVVNSLSSFSFSLYFSPFSYSDFIQIWIVTQKRNKKRVIFFLSLLLLFLPYSFLFWRVNFSTRWFFREKIVCKQKCWTKKSSLSPFSFFFSFSSSLSRSSNDTSNLHTIQMRMDERRGRKLSSLNNDWGRKEERKKLRRKENGWWSGDLVMAVIVLKAKNSRQWKKEGREWKNERKKRKVSVRKERRKMKWMKKHFNFSLFSSFFFSHFLS